MEDEMQCSVTQCDNLQPYSTPIEIAFLVITGLAIIYIGCLVTWVFLRQNQLTKVDFEYLLFLCLGAVLILLSLVAWPLNQTHIYCTVKPILLAFGTGLMIGTIFAKVFKVWNAFVRLPKKSLQYIIRRNNNAKLKENELRIVILIIVIIEVFLVLLFLFVPGWQPYCQCKAFMESGPVPYYTECNLSKGAILLIIVVNFIPVAVGLYWSYEVHRAFRKSDDQLLGKERHEVDDYRALLRSVAVLFVLGILTGSLTVLSGESVSDEGVRKVVYSIRSISTILAVLLPVSFIFHTRRKALSRKRKNKKKPAIYGLNGQQTSNEVTDASSIALTEKSKMKSEPQPKSSNPSNGESLTEDGSPDNQLSSPQNEEKGGEASGACVNIQVG